MTPFQQLYLGLGAKKKTYMEDTFTTHLFTGNSTARSINNGIDLSGEGGMVWIKSRETAQNHRLFDTARGVYKSLKTNSDGQEYNSGAGLTLDSFNNNGFSLGTSDDINKNNDDRSTWTFRKTKGFFDVVSFSSDENYSTKTINHNLGSVPGFIVIKKYNTSYSWIVWHRDLDTNKYLKLHLDDAESTDSNQVITNVTSTQFTIGADHNNGAGNWVAYLFAGGESTAATARSVEFDGSNDYMTIPTHADLAMGTGDLTWECWVLTDTTGVSKYIYDARDGTSANRAGIWLNDTNVIRVYVNNVSKDGSTVLNKGQWYHVAWTRQGTTSRLFINGIQELSWSDSIDYAAPASNSYIGGYPSQFNFDGKISNLRIVKGTAVYTSSFKPPTEPLTNITNTKLLCCNNSSVTGSTVSPTTIANNDATASTDSPFDDPAAFTFGDSKEGIIKCGSYVGNETSGSYPEINLGWEPQWVMIKRSSGAGHWYMWDTMRGFITGGTGANSPYFRANHSNAENNSYDVVQPTSTGFNLHATGDWINSNSSTYIYCAIRRPDGYVGKPADAGTDVFAMDTGNSSSSVPCFDSGFPVDFGLSREFAGGSSWTTNTRLMGPEALYTHNSNAEGTNNDAKFDHNAGYYQSRASNFQSWMWKRGQGFDVVNFVGNQTTNHQIPHSMNKVPEMMWFKSRGDSTDWAVYHKGLDGGTNPETHYMLLNSTDAEADGGMFSDTAPTSTHFTVGNFGESNDNNENMIAMLFASVSGISSVGSYSGNNSSSGPTITTGFSPRFILIKRANGIDNWFVFDTLRGINNGGNDARLKLDETGAQTTNSQWLSISSTGFTLNTNDAGVNASNSYIYYAHA